MSSNWPKRKCPRKILFVISFAFGATPVFASILAVGLYYFWDVATILWWILCIIVMLLLLQYIMLVFVCVTATLRGVQRIVTNYLIWFDAKFWIFAQHYWELFTILPVYYQYLFVFMPISQSVSALSVTHLLASGIPSHYQSERLRPSAHSSVA